MFFFFKNETLEVSEAEETLKNVVPHSYMSKRKQDNSEHFMLVALTVACVSTNRGDCFG